MKSAKTLALALAVSLILAGCSSLMGNITGNREDPSAGATPPSQSGGEDDTSEPPATGGENQPDTPPAAGGEDRPASPLEGFTVFPEGEYLSEKFRTSEPLPGYDYADTFRGNSVYGGTPVACSSPVAFYYPVHDTGTKVREGVYEGGKGYFLYYMDKATGISGALCGKAECTHADDTCNGYMSFTAPKGLSYYDGRIWWVFGDGMGSRVVKSCAPDGTDHREELRFSEDELEGSADIYFHRGVMYWASQTEVVTSGKAQLKSEIVAVPLDGSEHYVIFQGMDVGFPNVYPFRDKLLIAFDMGDVESHYDDAQGKWIYTQWEPAAAYYLYDLSTRTVETLFSGETDFAFDTTRAYLTQDGIYQMGQTLTAQGEEAECLRFLPWEGGEFVTQELPEELSELWRHGARHIRYALSGGDFTVSVGTLEDGIVLEAAVTDMELPEAGDASRTFAMLEGWDDDFYYFQIDRALAQWTVYIAVSVDGGTIYVFNGAEEP